MNISDFAIVLAPLQSGILLPSCSAGTTENRWSRSSTDTSRLTRRRRCCKLCRTRLRERITMARCSLSDSLVRLELRAARQPSGRVAGLFGFIALLPPLLLALAGCSDPSVDVPDISDVRHVASPDGHYVATTCLATSHMTTGSDRIVYLWPAGQKRCKLGRCDTPSHVLTCDGPAAVTWTSPTNLLVEYHPMGQWTSYPPAATNLYGVTIAFRRTEQPSH